MGGKGFLAAHFGIPEERSEINEKTKGTPATAAGQWSL